MSGDSEFTRREFVVGAISALAVVAMGPALAAIAPEAAGLMVFDPEHADACRRVEGAAAAQGCATLPVVGDRVRFGRDLFASGKAPAIVAGLTHYADYILLSGCAAEHGYRLQSVQVQTHLVEWTVAKPRRSISS